MAFERILLTGGDGFVGGHLAPALAQACPLARKLMLLRPGESSGHAAFESVHADLLDESAIDAIVSRAAPDLVIHLAGQASIGDAAKDAEATWRVNFHGSFGLGAALASRAPGATLLFASTAAVYGLSFRDGALTEVAPLQPIDVYSRSKAAAESALSDVLGPAARLIAARPVNHSGAGQKSRRFVLSSLAAQIADIEAGAAEPRLSVGDLSKARDFLDVRDVVDAYIRLIDKAPSLPARCVFNIGSGQAHTIQSLLDEMRGMARKEFSVDIDPALLRSAATDIPYIACDASKLTAMTGWRPQHTPREMLQAILDDWRAQQGAAS